MLKTYQFKYGDHKILFEKKARKKYACLHYPIVLNYSTNTNTLIAPKEHITYVVDPSPELLDALENIITNFNLILVENDI